MRYYCFEYTRNHHRSLGIVRADSQREATVKVVANHFYEESEGYPSEESMIQFAKVNHIRVDKVTWCNDIYVIE